MTLYKEWVNIAIYPLDSEHIRNREQRLSTEGLLAVSDKDYRPGNPGFLTQDQVVMSTEEFEAMAVDDYGRVSIWTDKRVLSVMQDDGLEKVRGWYRNPPEGIPRTMTLYKEWVNIAIYPLDSEHIRNREQRLSTEGLLAVSDKDYRPGNPGFLTQDQVVMSTEEFEAMAVDDYGRVSIWTDKRVLSVMQYRGVEKVYGWFRIPPVE